MSDLNGFLWNNAPSTFSLWKFNKQENIILYLFIKKFWKLKGGVFQNFDSELSVDFELDNSQYFLTMLTF